MPLTTSATSAFLQGLTLYMKPAQDGRSVGDCPFAHFVRMVLAEKGLECDLVPSTPENKPQWLLDDYGGKMPALCREKECHVDSEAIAQYIDSTFKEPKLSVGGDDLTNAQNAIDGFFPAMARFVKHKPNGNDEDKTKQAALETKLQTLEDYLSEKDWEGPYLVGDGKQFTLLDCSMAPKLYAMEICLREIKHNAIDLGHYPNVQKYMDNLFSRPSFRSTADYSPETVVWGWSSH
ncbi:hypothetical protein ACHAWF_018633 [Thalassiosira exigua]